MGKYFIISLGVALTWSVIAVLAGCCIDVADIFKVKYTKTEYISVPVTDLAELYVEAEVGSITIKGADVTDCNITAEISVRAGTKEKARKLAEQTRVEAETHDGKLGIKAVKPTTLKRNWLTVDYKITAPSQLNLDCTVRVGAIKISDVEGQIRASANVGSITCNQAAADINLQVNVGSVEIKYSNTAPATCNVDIVTNVGSIDFTGPPQLSAQIDARTNIGSIKTGRPITVLPRGQRSELGKVGRTLKGTIGSGQAEVRLKTNVGSIEIK